VIRFTDVTKEYARTGIALNDVSLHVAKGEFVFLTGPSGSGKSTILKLIYMEEMPTAGEVRVSGLSTASLRRGDVAKLRRKLGIVFQDFRLLDHMTTYENVALPFRVMGREESSYRREVIDLLKWVGLGERMDALPPILSGGEKQRAAIARAVISRPQLLLADEPTGNVDPTLGRRLLRLFIELNKSGTAVIIATHDITLMDQYDARRMVLHQGRIHFYE
jgi:cell division transport system ATP-binding protein